MPHTSTSNPLRRAEHARSPRPNATADRHPRSAALAPELVGCFRRITQMNGAARWQLRPLLAASASAAARASSGQQKLATARLGLEVPGDELLDVAADVPGPPTRASASRTIVRRGAAPRSCAALPRGTRFHRRATCVSSAGACSGQPHLALSPIAVEVRHLAEPAQESFLGRTRTWLLSRRVRRTQRAREQFHQARRSAGSLDGRCGNGGKSVLADRERRRHSERDEHGGAAPVGGPSRGPCRKCSPGPRRPKSSTVSPTAS